MEFEKYLISVAKELDKEVEKILEEQLKEAEKTDKKLVPLLQAFIKSCQGGKRIRGVLIKLGYELANGKSVDIIKIGAAYEIFHSAILIHDDIIDQSALRRNKPSLYKELGGNHYGISQAISLGDYGFFLAFKIISETNFADNDKIKALGLFSQVVMDTVWGEMLDLEKTDPLTVMRLKTARYSIAGPLQIGAVLACPPSAVASGDCRRAGADEKLIMTLGTFGEKLGIAYQMQDDILDEEIKIKNGIEKHINQAMKALPEITKDKDMSKLLEQMGEYLVRRTK